MSPLDSAKHALAKFKAAKGASASSDHDVLVVLADAADQASFEAVSASTSDRDTFMMQIQTFAALDEYICESLMTADNDGLKKQFANRLIERADQRCIVPGGMAFQEAGQRFQWATMLDPANGYAFYRTGMCQHILGKWCIEDDNDFKTAKQHLLDARGYLRKASEKIPERQDVWNMLEQTEAFLQQCD